MDEAGGLISEITSPLFSPPVTMDSFCEESPVDICLNSNFLFFFTKTTFMESSSNMATCGITIVSPIKSAITRLLAVKPGSGSSRRLSIEASTSKNFTFESPLSDCPTGSFLVILPKA